MLPLISIFLIGLDYNAVHDTTPEIPIKLNKYRYPEVLYSSNEKHFGNVYKSFVETFDAEAKDVGKKNISEGKFNIYN